MPSTTNQALAVAGHAAQAVAAVVTAGHQQQPNLERQLAVAGAQQLQPHAPAPGQPSCVCLLLGWIQGASQLTVRVLALSAPAPRGWTLASRTVQYALPAALSHFGPSIGVAVVDNLFGAMTGGKALVLAQQKLTWMVLASKYSAPVGASVRLCVVVL